MIARLLILALLAFRIGVGVSGTRTCRIQAPYRGIVVARVEAGSEHGIWDELDAICERRHLENGVLLLTDAQFRLVQSASLRTNIEDRVKYKVFEHDLGARIAAERRMACGEFNFSASVADADGVELRSNEARGLAHYLDGTQWRQSPVLNPMFYEKFRPYKSLVTRWQEITTTFNNARLQRIGLSVERRTLYAIRIGRSGAGRQVLLLFGQHAREWASIASGTYVSEYLAQLGVPQDVEVIIVPLVNPDGYEYSRIHDRLWRKNRSHLSECNLTRSMSGVDLNRNWGKDFGGIQATSTDSCSDLYHGNKAFSEPETSAIRALTLKLPRLVAMMDIHSYSQLVIGPWAHTNAIPPNSKQVDEIGMKIAKAATKNGAMYLYGRGDNNMMYLASGVAPDWFFSRGVKATYTLELRPGRFEPLGFELPPSLIIPTAMDALEAANVLVQFASNEIETQKRRHNAIHAQNTSSISIILGVSLTALVVILIALALTLIIRRRKTNSNTNISSTDSASDS